MAISSHVVAQRLLDMAEGANKTLTPMQIIKLTYLAHGWMLALYNRPLIVERIEAWQYGPVIPSLYHAIKSFRSSPVESVTPHGRMDTGELEKDPNAVNVVEQVYQLYGHLDGLTLSELTHEPNTPWDITWREPGPNNVISNDLIESYFKELSSRQGVEV